jgi:hypothetical protein
MTPEPTELGTCDRKMGPGGGVIHPADNTKPHEKWKDCINWRPLPEPSPGHDYLSTACLHERHGQCRHSCKFCGVQCRCECHHDP